MKKLGKQCDIVLGSFGTMVFQNHSVIIPTSTKTVSTSDLLHENYQGSV